MISRIKNFLNSIANGALGILAEIALVAFFIFAGFVICIVWWGILR